MTEHSSTYTPVVRKTVSEVELETHHYTCTCGFQTFEAADMRRHIAEETDE